MYFSIWYFNFKELDRRLSSKCYIQECGCKKNKTDEEI